MSMMTEEFVCARCRKSFQSWKKAQQQLRESGQSHRCYEVPASKKEAVVR